MLRKFPVFVAVAFLAASTIPSRAVAQQLVIVEQASHHPGVITAIPAPQATLLIEAYNPDGSAVGLQGFIDYTHYVASSKWQSFENYGVFPLGQIPGVASVSSALTVEPNGALEYMSFKVPANQPIYFTALWKAQGIGTVFMRADNAGLGYTLSENQRQVLQLPYEFASSEYALANRLHSTAVSSGMIFSTDVENDLTRSAALVESARVATSSAARAATAYEALAIVMLLKERIVLESSDRAIADVGLRTDFDFNYEGFGSWTDLQFVPDYQRARTAGFKSVLTLCDWNVISPSPGVYDFTALDYQVSQAKALGYAVSLTVNQSIGAMPSWVGSLPSGDLTNLYFENARRVVERYKGQVSTFYADAEPELQTGARTLAQLADLVRASLAGAKAAAADIPAGLYLSASAYVTYQMNPQESQAVVSGWSLLTYLVSNSIRPDFVGLEMQYGTVFAPIDLQRMQELLRAVSDAAQAPVYIGETGYSSKAQDYGSDAPFYWHGGLTQQAQAEWADGVLRVAYGLPFVKGLYWVHVDPDDFDYGSDFLSSLIGSGLFRPDGTSKRALTTFQNFAHQITCSFSLTTSAADVPAAGSAGSVAVAAASGCSWTSATNVPWIVITSAASGSGSGTLAFTVASYSSAQPRVGLIRIANQTFTVTQAPASTLSVDRAALHFGVVTSGLSFGPKTGSQTVRLTQSGPGTIAWTATSNAPWLTVTPSSGTGSAIVTVDVQFVFGLQPDVAGAITIAAAGAANIIPPVAVTLRSALKGQVAAPFGSFDKPDSGTTGATGSIAVSGWALDDVAVTRVGIWRERVSPEENSLVFIGDAIFLDGARGDVQAAFPSYPQNTRGGWGYLMLTNFLPNGGNGTFTLHAIAEDADGHDADLGTKIISFDNAHADRPFGAIDTPEQGQTICGTSYINFGWALTQSPKDVAQDSSTITALVDGVAVGHPLSRAARADLTAFFPTYTTSHAAGGLVMDTTAFANGVHTIAWFVVDSAGRADGIGSRFFTVSNPCPATLRTDPDAPTVPPANEISARATLQVSIGSALRVDDGATVAIAVAAAAIAAEGVLGRRGFDVNTPLQRYTATAGRVTVQAEELDRIELQFASPADHEYTGYLRTATGLAPLPIGSRFESATGVFTWMPGAGFAGSYDLVFVQWSGGRAVTRQDVRVVLNPKGSNRVGAQTIIDIPRQQDGGTAAITVGSSFFLAGWAADLDSTFDRGVDTVQVWAYPVNDAGQREQPFFLGTAVYGGRRPDVAAVYGDRFTETGYGMVVQGLVPGTYDIAVFTHSAVGNRFAPARTVRVSVQ